MFQCIAKLNSQSCDISAMSVQQYIEQQEKLINQKFYTFFKSRNGHIAVKCVSGFLGEFSKEQRDYIKKIGIQKYFNKFPSLYKQQNEDIVLIGKMEDFDFNAGDTDECIICTEIIDSIYAMGKCKHSLCHKCMIRWRIICNKDSCPLCSGLLNEIYFTKRKNTPQDMLFKGNSGFLYESVDIEEEIRKLLLHVCKICEQSFTDFSDLEKHLDANHSKVFCDICVRHLKIYSIERELYIRDELAAHSRKEHMPCKFCRVFYADDADLYHHLATQHFECSLCSNASEEASSAAVKPSLAFYSDLVELTAHYNASHKVCKLCMESDPLLAAYPDEKSLMAHMQSVHKHKKKQKFHRFTDCEIPLEIKKAENIFDYGKIAYVIEKGHSFIIPHNCRSKSRKDNVYFPVESMGFNQSEDLRKHVKHGDLVRYVAIEQPGNLGSRWKATTVEKVAKSEYEKFTKPDINEQENQLVDTANVVNLERYGLFNEPGFSGALLTAPAPPPVSISTDWSSMVKKPPIVPPPTTPKKKLPVTNMKNDNETANFGYIFNLESRFGFITKKQNVSGGKENVFFDIKAYEKGFIGEQINCTDLTRFLDNGMKLYYESCKSASKDKPRAKIVWRLKDRVQAAAALVSQLPDSKDLKASEVKATMNKKTSSSMNSLSSLSGSSKEVDSSKLGEDKLQSSTNPGKTNRPPLSVSVTRKIGSDHGQKEPSTTDVMKISIPTDSNFVVIEDLANNGCGNKEQADIDNSNDGSKEDDSGEESGDVIAGTKMSGPVENGTSATKPQSLNQQKESQEPPQTDPAIIVSFGNIKEKQLGNSLRDSIEKDDSFIVSEPPCATNDGSQNKMPSQFVTPSGLITNSLIGMPPGIITPNSRKPSCDTDSTSSCMPLPTATHEMPQHTTAASPVPTNAVTAEWLAHVAAANLAPPVTRLSHLPRHVQHGTMPSYQVAPHSTQPMIYSGLPSGIYSNPVTLPFPYMSGFSNGASGGQYMMSSSNGSPAGSSDHLPHRSVSECFDEGYMTTINRHYDNGYGNDDFPNDFSDEDIDDDDSVELNDDVERFFTVIDEFFGKKGSAQFIKLALFAKDFGAKSLCFVELYPHKGTVYFVCYNRSTMALSKRLKVPDKFQINVDLKDMLQKKVLVQTDAHMYQMNYTKHFIQTIENSKKQISKISCYFHI